MEKISKSTSEKLKKLTESQLRKLADLIDVGIMNNPDDLDKEELILILHTESETKILAALKRLTFVK